MVTNREAEFRYNEEVEIKTGFYKGYRGTIKQYNGKQYSILCIIDDKKVEVICEKEDIGKIKGILNKILGE